MEIEKIKVNAIVQINKLDDHGTALRYMVVTKLETWGVRGMLIHNGELVGRPWSHIEPTGGAAVFDHSGERLLPDVPRLKHHE